MAKVARVSTKRILIDKANTAIVIAVGVAAFVTVFSLVSSRSLLARRSYQAKVIAAREDARDQLKENLDAINDLKNSYRGFVDRPQNIIGGSSSGQGERDGDNAKIVLDALPSKYDFPALVTSLEKILDERNYVIESITGVDDEATHNPSASGTNMPSATSSAPLQTTQGTTSEQGSQNEPTPMPFQIGAKGNYASLIDLLQAFKLSIRPLSIQQVSFGANQDGTASLMLTGQSYYQAEKTLSITEEVVP